MDVRVSPDRNSLAVRTADNVTAGTWFVYHHDRGGSYTDGVFEGVDTWTPAPVPEQETRQEEE